QPTNGPAHAPRPGRPTAARAVRVAAAGTILAGTHGEHEIRQGRRADGVTQARHATTSRNNVTQQRHATASRNNVTQQRHATTSRNNVTQQRHATTSRNNVTQQ